MRLLGLSPTAVATPEMRALWTDRATLQSVLDVEAALARAQAHLGIIPADSAPAIAAACDASLYDLDAIAQGALRAGTAAIPIVAALTAHLRRHAPEAAGHAHYGATSQDVLDTGLILQLRRAVALTAGQGRALVAHLRDLSDLHAQTPMLGRTVLQPGPPITLGLKAAGWMAAIARGTDRLESAATEALILQFGGAVGTLASLGDRGQQVADALGADLNLPVPAAPWHPHRDRLAALASAAAILGGGLAKLARDLALLGQAELAEVAEPGGDGRGGSSTMPHKRNPMASVVTLAAANRLPGHVASLLAGLDQEHERAAGAWQAEAAVHADIFLALSGALDAMIEATAGLRVDPAAMAANIEALGGLILAERLTFRLAPALGRGPAHHLVESLVREAVATARHLRDVAAADPAVAAHLTPAEIADTFDPAGYLGVAETFRARLLAAHPGDP